MIASLQQVQAIVNNNAMAVRDLENSVEQLVSLQPQQQSVSQSELRQYHTMRKELTTVCAQLESRISAYTDEITNLEQRLNRRANQLNAQLDSTASSSSSTSTSSSSTRASNSSSSSSTGKVMGVIQYVFRVLAGGNNTPLVVASVLLFILLCARAFRSK
eukprot:TRINITY_DN3398_c0_g1_i1.p2 TRINITY_DN3398_c0_g1~~TRINITY_DN3398_c0_g1_i1.p2  ORF type:complete len:160 (-),score=52.01 TRINITY_DN3398_c0_g1_i1:399-878(-)